jgi:O-antigen/teichoic acid export membrane protein
MTTKGRFSRDVLWVLGSLVIAGMGGIAANALIAAHMGSAALGVFNQAFALYIVLSQLAVGGLQFSVLRHVSQKQDDLRHASEAACSAMLLVSGFSALMCTIAWLTRGWVGYLLNSQDLPTAVGLMLPGLFFFSLNKLLLNVLTGLRHMRAYAVFQSLRFVLLFLAIAVLAALNRPGRELTMALTIAECALFVGLVGYIRLKVFAFRVGGEWRAWCAAHLGFGIRGFLSGVLHEINTRVDILLLGYFRDDVTVGIYSFAAILAEGAAQIPLAMRTNVDPIIGAHLARDERSEIEAFSRRVRRVFFPIMLGISIVAVGAYPLVLKVLGVATDFLSSWPVFAILMAGIALNAWVRPFMGILLQAGRPGAHTLVTAIVVLTNIALNLALIPMYGAAGSASATACAYVAEAVMIFVLAKRLVRVSL